MSNKATKRALLTSALALLLCVSMLVGTTYAWFTDSVTSANNKIVAGNLKIDLELLEKDGSWTSIKESPKAIFDYENWEPGYIDVKVLRVVNEGSLALKWVAKFVSNEALGILADVIDVYVTEDIETYPTDRADLSDWDKVGTVRDFANTIDTLWAGSLTAKNTAGATKTLGIALKMQETAGNEYQNQTLGAFDIQILATQYTYEEDSFGNDYDDLEFIGEGDVMHEEDGIKYIYHANGDITLYHVTSEYTETELYIKEGVTALGNGSIGSASSPYVKKVVLPSTVKKIGTAFQKNVNIEEVVLNEGLTEIPEKAFNQATALKSVNIPSTVEKIGFNAFRMIAVEELTIPATVKELAEGAFRNMPNAKTVTIEGGTLIGNFAFRECASLENVYLKNYDVRFAGTSMAFSNAQSGKADNITITVVNEAVKERVVTANGSCTGYTVVVDGHEMVADDLYTDGINYYAYSNTGLEAALNSGANTVVLSSGSYIIPAAAKGKTLTIIGSGDTSVAVTKVGSGGENCDFGLDGSTVTFENVTITTNSSTYIGYARCNGTYKNCTFNGTYTLYGNSVFENCTFNVSGDVYNLWTWGAPTATFTGCTFNSDGKALLLYGTVDTKLTVNNCTFNDNGGLADLKAAIEIGNEYGKSYELIVNNTTVNGYEINDKGISTGTTLWANKNSMGTDKLNVVVDGVDKY